MEKSLAANAYYNIIYRVLNLLFPLVTSTYIARILLPDGVGMVTVALNVVQYFVVFAGLGIPNYGIREIAKVRTDQEKVNKVFSELICLNAISTTICLLLYLFMIVNFEYFHEDNKLYFAVSILLIINYINIDWFYQGNEEYRFIAIRNLIVKTSSILLLIIFVKQREDYLKYTLIYCAALGGNHILNILNLKGKVNFTFSRLNITRHLKPVLILLASTIAIELYTMMDVTMLGIFCEDAVVGYYNNASKFARVVTTLVASVGTVLLPRLSYYFTHDKLHEFSEVIKTVREVLIYVTIPAVIGMMLLSEDIICVLFGKSFQPASLTLTIMAPLVFAVVFNNFYGTQVLITLGQEKRLLYSVFVGAIVNLILNSILIPHFEHNGAAVASVLSEMMVWLCTRHYAAEFIDVPIEKKQVLAVVGASIFMAVFVYLITLLNLPMIVELVVSVIIGVLLYGSATILFKVPIAVEIFKRIENFAKAKLK